MRVRFSPPTRPRSHPAGLLRLSEPRSAAGDAVDESQDVFAAWLTHADAPDGAVEEDLHVWCEAVQPPPADSEGDPSSIYGILSEAPEDLDRL